MRPENLTSTLARGAAALRAIEGELRAALPPPDRPDAALLRAVRDVASLASRVEVVAEIEGDDQDTTYARDAALSMEFGDAEIAEVASWIARLEAESPYADGALPARTADHLDALRALRAVLERYATGEFMPPNSWFGIPD